MDEEAADELMGGERHGLVSLTALGAVILPFEGHTLVVKGNEPRVDDGDAVGVAGEIGEHGTRSGKRPLGVDDPIDLAQAAEVVGESPRVGEWRMIAEEPQTTGGVGFGELVEEQSAEQPGQHAHG